jgi:hypothetical protein
MLSLAEEALEEKTMGVSGSSDFAYFVRLLLKKSTTSVVKRHQFPSPEMTVHLSFRRSCHLRH